MNTKVNEVQKSILYLSSSEEDRKRLIMIANIGDVISNLARTGDLTPTIMRDHITLHINELKAIENSEVRELIAKATWAEVQVEARKVTEVFGNEVFENFMKDLREIGQF